MQNNYARPHMANVLFLIYLQVLSSLSVCSKLVAWGWQLHLGGSAPACTLPAPLSAPGAVPGGKLAQGADWAEN